MVLFGEARDRDADKCIEDRKSGAAEQAHLPVFNPEAFLDRLGQYVDDRTIDEIENIDREQDSENIFAVVFTAISRFRASTIIGTTVGMCDVVDCSFGQIQTPIAFPN